jgi:hypothetical protein
MGYIEAALSDCLCRVKSVTNNFTIMDERIIMSLSASQFATNEASILTCIVCSLSIVQEGLSYCTSMREIYRSVRINCLVGKFPFVILNGHHHKRSIELFQRLQNI